MASKRAGRRREKRTAASLSGVRAGSRRVARNRSRAVKGSSNFVADFLDNWFPERQLFFRAHGEVSFISLSRRAQIFLAVLLLVFSGWVTYASVYYLSFDWILKQKNSQIAEARIAYRDVMDEVASYNDRLRTITFNLERSQAQLLALFGRNRHDVVAGGGPEGRFDVLDRIMGAASHRAFIAQIHELQNDWLELTTRNTSLESGLASIGDEVEQMLANNAAVVTERNTLRNRVASLETNLGDLRSSQQEFVLRLTERTVSSIEEVERVIKIAGLNADRLIDRTARARSSTGGQGGPFVELSKEQIEGGGPLERSVAMLDAKMSRWQNLRTVLRGLPLSAPLDHYRMASSYGKRKDPVNKRWAFHYGVDLAYQYKTPVMSPAPGRVSFTGWRGGLGWLIEIDHGMGIRTRYGHLKKILVKRGQRVDFRQKIGLLGNSGRSTGPHVHYEVLVDGKPQNPLKFMKAGKYVFKS